MAPEIVKKHQDRVGYKQADIWALGVVFYSLLTGKFPFKGSSSKEIFKESLYGNYPALPKGVSQDAKRLLIKMIMVDPSK